MIDRMSAVLTWIRQYQAWREQVAETGVGCMPDGLAGLSCAVPAQSRCPPAGGTCCRRTTAAPTGAASSHPLGHTARQCGPLPRRPDAPGHSALGGRDEGPRPRRGPTSWGACGIPRAATRGHRMCTQLSPSQLPMQRSFAVRTCLSHTSAEESGPNPCRSLRAVHGVVPNASRRPGIRMWARVPTCGDSCASRLAPRLNRRPCMRSSFRQDPTHPPRGSARKLDSFPESGQGRTRRSATWGPVI